MSFLAFLALLGITLGLRWLGNRLIPLAMPPGLLKPLGAGLAAGALGGTFLEVGPQLSWLHPAGAALGVASALVLLGIAPFLKILLGRTETQPKAAKTRPKAEELPLPEGSAQRRR